MTVKMWTRAEWNAVAPRNIRTDVEPHGIALHWYGAGSYIETDHGLCLKYVKAAQTAHMQNSNVNDIYYNLIVCVHGIIEGRSTLSQPRVRGGANGTAESNEHYYSILHLCGRDDKRPLPPTLLNSSRAARDFLRSNARAGAMIKVHRDFVSTECPGPELYEWARAGMPERINEGTSEMSVWDENVKAQKWAWDNGHYEGSGFESREDVTAGWHLANLNAHMRALRMQDIRTIYSRLDQIEDRINSISEANKETIKQALREVLTEGIG